jgi:hypothetical protein
LGADGCGHLLNGAALATALLGPHRTLVTIHSPDPVFALVGGLGCAYDFGDTDHVGQVAVVVVPSAVADAAEVKASLSTASCGSQPNLPSGCSTTGVLGGWWYELTDFSENFSTAHAELAKFATMVTDLRKSLTATTAPQQVNLTVPFDCAAVTAPGVLAARVRAIPEDEWSNTEIRAAAFLLGGAATCSYGLSGGLNWDLTVYPGGAPAYASCTRADGGTGAPVSVPGVKSAFAWNVAPYPGPQLCATDGTSTISAVEEGSDGESPFTRAELKSLGSLLVPVFAAAVSSSAPWTAALSSSPSPHTVSAPGGGDCKKLLETNAGPSTSPVPTSADVAVGDPLLASVGGFDCSYKFTTSHSGVTTDIHALAAPSAIADPAERADSLTPPVCGPDPQVHGGLICAETALESGWWYSIQLATSTNGGNDSSNAAALANLASISGALDQVLNSTTAPTSVHPVRPSGCPATLGGAGVASSRTMLGGGYWDDNEIRGAAFLLAGPVTCSFTAPKGDRWALTVYSGSTSAYVACTHDILSETGHTKSITVPGVKSAFSLGNDGDGDGDSVAVCATDGTSTVWAIDDGDDNPNWSTARLKALGSYLVPMFAAAS